MESNIHNRLMRGIPVPVDMTLVYLPTLAEIFDLGLDTYLEYLQSIIIDITELDLNLDEVGGESLSDYEIFLLLTMIDKRMKDTFFKAIQFFTHDTFVMEESIGIVSVKELVNPTTKESGLNLHQFLTEEFWLGLRKVLILAHWQKEPKRYEYVSAQAKAIMEKIRRNKEEVQKIKAKNGQGNSIELYELIGSVCTHSHSYNLFNVWDLTYYQFFDHYYRLNINDDYDYSLRSILAGADPKKVKIAHWTSSIKHN